MAERTRICQTCGEPFSYVISRGNDRIRCSKVCRERAKLAYREARLPTLPLCCVPECGQPATRIKDQVCERHHARLRRSGTTNTTAKRRLSGDRRWHDAGYVRVFDPSHPLADSTGEVFEHRRIVYDRCNGVAPGCFWCGTALEWSTLHSDHLNDQKADNRSENLVASCARCNQQRSLNFGFVARLTPAGLHEYIARLRECNAAARASGQIDSFAREAERAAMVERRSLARRKTARETFGRALAERSA